MDEEIKYANARQCGEKTEYSYEEKNNKSYFTIKQGVNKIFLQKSQVLFIVEKGIQMMNRWKVNG